MGANESRRIRSSHYYNRNAKDLECLKKGETVRIQPLVAGNSRWAKGTVTKRLDERSYEVATDTGSYRRNRVHLRPSKEQQIPVTQGPRVTRSAEKNSTIREETTQAPRRSVRKRIPNKLYSKDHFVLPKQ